MNYQMIYELFLFLVSSLFSFKPNEEYVSFSLLI